MLHETRQVHQEFPRSSIRPRFLRLVAAVAWAVLLLTFWLLLRDPSTGPVGQLREVAESPRAPLLLLALYGLRPLLLVPITVLNLATGFALGPVAGITLALIGTLLSASVGYTIGRMFGSAQIAERAADRWRLVRVMRERSFEAVAAGGLMYLHADLVNLPAGVLRIGFPTFLLGIAVGNALTLSMAVLAGAAIDAGESGAPASLNLEYVVAAATLFVVTVLLARVFRRRLEPGSGPVEGSAE